MGLEKLLFVRLSLHTFMYFCCLHFSGHFSKWTWVNRRSVFYIGAKDVQRRAKLQSVLTTNIPTPSFLLAGLPSCRPANSVKAPKEKVPHSAELLTPNSPGGFFNFLLTTKGSWLSWGGLPSFSSRSLLPVPPKKIKHTHLMTSR